MALLIVGIVVFLGIHLLPTFPHLRGALIGRFGENGYRILFSVLSVAGFVLLVWGFFRAPVIQVWSPPAWTRWVAIVLMLPAFIFLVAAYVPGRIKARLKHPFLVAIKTWALAHLIANGDLASIVLFSSFLAYAIYDRIAVKGRAETGIVTTPRTGPARNDIIAVVVGAALYLVFLIWLHPLLMGRAVVPH
ncbi:MAG: NnrU family protein [Methyloceanibacter sp.]